MNVGLFAKHLPALKATRETNRRYQPKISMPGTQPGRRIIQWFHLEFKKIRQNIYKVK